jgi:hypothetical protein
LQVPARHFPHGGHDAASSVLAMVAVKHKRVILPIKDNTQNGSHHLKSHSFLFGALDVEDDMADTITREKRLKFMVLIFFLDKSPVMYVSMCL